MIILLGLPKCGNVSFTHALTAVGYNVAPWKGKDYTAKLIFKANNESKPILYYLQNYDAFVETSYITDKEWLMPTVVFYKKFYYHYPDSLFILNHRNVDNHVKSIQNWISLEQRLRKNGISDLYRFVTNHNRNIESFYKNKRNFLSFNIERDSDEKLSDFIGKEIHLPVLNKTL